VLVLKRAYLQPDRRDGTRFLVDRLWPRGINRTGLRIDEWLKDVAPSGSLRRWFAHDPAKWSEFRRRYFAELDNQPEVCARIRRAARRGRVTLVYGARDALHNNAAALKEYLNARMIRRKRTVHASV